MKLPKLRLTPSFFRIWKINFIKTHSNKVFFVRYKLSVTKNLMSLIYENLICSHSEKVAVVLSILVTLLVIITELGFFSLLYIDTSGPRYRKSFSSIRYEVSNHKTQFDVLFLPNYSKTFLLKSWKISRKFYPVATCHKTVSFTEYLK